jgi:aldose 1-epimerase
MTIQPFGTTSDGRSVQAITLAHGDLRATVLTWGAVLNDLRLAGVGHSLTLGSDQFAGYEGRMGYFGAIVGPVANRIGGAQGRIGGQLYRFAANEPKAVLHGGLTGTQNQLWDIVDHGATHVTLGLTLPAGHGGFPGNRRLSARYGLETPDTLVLTLTGTTDAETLINLASHGYWNLDGSADIRGHHLRIAADTYLPTVDNLPTGEVRPVSGAFDLRQGRVLDLSEGYDHNFCLAPAPRPLAFAAELTGRSGIRLTLDTTEPGLQVYDGRTTDSTPIPGHAGHPYGPYAGIALEAQRWPDAPNHPGFPTITLTPGDTCTQVTRFRFSRG